MASLIDQAVEGLYAEAPFSFDFYITGRSGSNEQYDQYFVRDYENQSWFMIRKSFISSNIEESFNDKMQQMDVVMARAKAIDQQYEEKCLNFQDKFVWFFINWFS